MKDWKCNAAESDFCLFLTCASPFGAVTQPREGWTAPWLLSPVINETSGMLP